jgi:subtilisin family serine protease
LDFFRKHFYNEKRPEEPISRAGGRDATSPLVSSCYGGNNPKIRIGQFWRKEMCIMRSNKRSSLAYGLSACVVLLVWVFSGSPVWAGGKVGFGLERAVKALGDPARLRAIPGVFYRGDEPYIKVFLKLSDVPAEIEEAGVELRVGSGGVYTARMPVAQVKSLASLPQVIRMEATRKLKPLLEVSVPDISAVEVWNKSRWGNQGENVIVGMLDSGIFYEHEAFRDEAGNNRILYILDYTNDTECDAASIQDRSCETTDRDGHGTGVMGVAAGAGIDACQPKEACVGRGVAPKASIIAVKLANWDEEELTEGVAYIFAKAAGLGMPAVVNLSLGGFGGPLDGSSLVEQFISNQTGPGRIVVAAAGNEALRRAHAAVSVAQGMDGWVFAFIAQNVSPVGRLASAEIFGWYDFSQGDLTDIEVKIFAFQTEVTDWVGFGESVEDVVTPDGIVSLYYTGETDDARGFFLEIQDANTIEWRIQVRGQGQGQGPVDVDLWINQTFPDPVPGELPKFFFTLAHQDEWQRKTVMSPCTADEVICVGSYNTNCDVDGACEEFGDVEGGVSVFSSIGPRRNGGRGWPFVVAPGQAILTAYVDGEDSYAYWSGTSFSSPHVAGTVALMLRAEARSGQDDPRLTPDEVRDALKYTQDVAEGERPIWKDDARGWGKLDAFKAVDEAILPLPPPPPPKPNGLGGGDDICFIATAAFGDIDAPQVRLLREMRDRSLWKTEWGRRFVRFYYRCSPPVAAWLKEHAVVSRLVRASLLPAVGWSETVYHRSPRERAILFGLGLSLISAVCYFSIRRRTR